MHSYTMSLWYCLYEIINSQSWPRYGQIKFPIYHWWVYKILQPLWKTVWQLLQLNKFLPQDSAVLVLDIYPEGLKTYVYSETCTWKFTVAFFIIAKTWKQSKCLPIHELINCGISRQHYIKEMSYSMKRHGGIESILLWQFERLQTIWFELYDIVENVQLWRQWKDQSLLNV